MSSSCAARGAPGSAPGGSAVPLILAALCLVLGLALYGVLAGSAADRGAQVPGAAQPYDVAEPGDDAHKAFGFDAPSWLNAVPPDTAAFLLSLVFFTVAASGGLLPRFLRGPPARRQISPWGAPRALREVRSTAPVRRPVLASNRRLGFGTTRVAGQNPKRKTHDEHDEARVDPQRAAEAGSAGQRRAPPAAGAQGQDATRH